MIFRIARREKIRKFDPRLLGVIYLFPFITLVSLSLQML
jgi:hypothetical protein